MFWKGEMGGEIYDGLIGNVLEGRDGGEIHDGLIGYVLEGRDAEKYMMV